MHHKDMKSIFTTLTKLAAIAAVSFGVNPAYAAKNRVINGCVIKPQTPCRNMDLSGQNLVNARLDGADLSGANLSGAKLNGARLQGANLKDAVLTGAKIRNANLMAAVLKQASLEEADLTGAKLVSANLQYANLRRTNLTRVKATSSDLYGADLTDANLTRANFKSSNLTRAVLAGSLQKNTKLVDVVWDSPDDPGQDIFSLSADGFANNSPIPKANACGGVSPALRWSRVPEGTKAFALLVEDLDFSYGGTALPYGNWGIFNLPGQLAGLGEGASTNLPEGTLDAVNDTIFAAAYSGRPYQDAFGYNAPCPPVFGEKHRFKFTLWALSAPIPEDAFNYAWKDFYSDPFPYTWVMSRVLEGIDPKYPDLSGLVIGKASVIGTVIR